MTDRPIIFSTPMVRAILREINEPDTGKMVTRRVIKPLPGFSLFDGTWTDDYVLDSGNAEWRQRDVRYAPGDQLWVRESWVPVPASAYRYSEGVHQTVNPADPYEAAIYAAGWDRSIPKWKPSIHMPRWASRITLYVTDVRIERLQDITEDEARHEGAERLVMDDDGRFFQSDKGNYRIGFAGLWEHLNGKRGFGWDTNPWVAAISFRPELRNIDKVRG